jgi:hypothetical protein
MMMLVLHKRGALKVKGIYFFDKEACFADDFFNCCLSMQLWLDEFVSLRLIKNK